VGFAIVFVTIVFYQSIQLFPNSANNLEKISKKDQQKFFQKFTGRGDSHPNLRSLDLEDARNAENADFFDSIANDIIQTLDCDTLLEQQTPVWRNGDYVYGAKEEILRRKLLLEEEVEETEPRDDDTADDPAGEQGVYLDTRDRPDRNMFDDDPNGLKKEYGLVTGAHLFCLAAYPRSETAFWNDKIQCKVYEKQKEILDLWSTAQTEILDPHVLQRTLALVTEQSITLMEKTLYVWSSPRDDGTTYMTGNLNDQLKNQRAGNYGGVAGLADNLGAKKLYVDVGSGLGYTAFAVAILYPGTEIVSIEAASTNWLLQSMNWICNDFENTQKPSKVILAGVGPSAGTAQAAKFIWRPTATTSTRSWSLTVEDEEGNSRTDTAGKAEDDIEISVKLKPWHSIQTEAEIRDRKIDVLNVDCEGCEYNLIPSLSEEEFRYISSILGQVHWGYIPKAKLPSSKRGRETHERLCEHENFARSSIECCAFPSLPVKSSFSGELLILDADAFPPQQATVRDLAEDLCDRFDEWAIEHHLSSVESDWGWFQISSLKEPTSRETI
jgi:FkbM family methyltransferase